MSIETKITQEQENNKTNLASQRNEITRAFGLYSRYKTQDFLDQLCETLAKVEKELQDQNTNQTENKNVEKLQND